MIPKIIHQTWKNETIKEEWIPFQEKVKALHPDWEYRLWTDDMNDEFVQSNFPEFYPIFQNYPENIMRADVIRYLIMDKMGGLYLDLDYEMLQPFDLIDKAVVLPWNRQLRLNNPYDGVGNCFFASEPHHPFWEIVIKELSKPQIENVLDDPAIQAYITKKTTAIEATTGPNFLTKVYHEHKEELKDIFLPPRELFHPETPRSKAQHERIIRDDIAYGIHHCHGTWRTQGFLKKMKYKLFGNK